MQYKSEESAYAKAIEENYLDHNFDVAAISDLSHRERAAFKPIYSMNKYWARRSSSVFRAILIGLNLPTRADLMKNFYLNHQSKLSQKNKIILDPFMGGGTTIVESLRLGYKAVGTDLNPLSWFIVKTETTRISINKLEDAFRRVENEVAQKISSLYQTECPCCEQSAEIIYALWTKVAQCSHRGCNDEVELFRDYIVGQRRGNATINYFEVECPNCELNFELDQEFASIAPEIPNHSFLSAENSKVKSWSTIQKNSKASCPRCSEVFNPELNEKNYRSKKVTLFAILCPDCKSVYSHRGAVPERISCPHCSNVYNPHKGTTNRGAFTCQNGHTTAITEASNVNGSPLPFKMYAIEGFCSYCAGKNDQIENLLPGIEVKKSKFSSKPQITCSNCQTVNYKFFKKPDASDLEKYESASLNWEVQKDNLPFPKEGINDYEKTNRLVIHNYKYWHQLFNPRQLLSLSLMLEQILIEPDQAIKESLLAAFLGTLEHQNMLNIYYVPYAQSAGAFGRHDFHPKVMACEGNPWGGSKGRGTFLMAYQTVLNGKKYLNEPYEAKYHHNGNAKRKRENVLTADSFSGLFTQNFEDLVEGKANTFLNTGDSRNLSFIPPESIDHVVTDPPYADAVQYAEMADFFYVWLRLVLHQDYPELFENLETPKKEEIVENVRRKKSRMDFYEGLQQVLSECHRVLKPDGRLVFTFHHSKGEQWGDLLNTLLNAGFMINAVYPVKSEATESGNLVFHSNSSSSIAFDIIHVCQKTPPDIQDKKQTPILWAELVPIISKRVKEHIQAIKAQGEAGRQLSASDVRIMLWGECLAVFSHTAGEVLSAAGENMDINSILDKSTELVEEILAEQNFS